MKHKSLDAIEKEYFAPSPAPFETPAEFLEESHEESAVPADKTGFISLNGRFQMAEGGYVADRTDLTKEWSDAIPADVPGTVHTALFNAGKIPDPLFGKNDKAAREESYKTWWFKKEFNYDFSLENPRLCFDGVCYNAVFWLNGVFLGGHIGMFGGPFFEVENILKEKNILIVKIENAPADPRPYSEYADHDEGWKYGVVVNCVYGWHYACIPTRGIWAGVSLKGTPAVPAERPFIVTKDYKNGIADICIKLGKMASGSVKIKVSPHNFDGRVQFYSVRFSESSSLHYRIKLGNVRLWWPNGYGEQNLYRFDISVTADGDICQSFTEITGIRKIEMLPAGEPREDTYNWLCHINGKYIFLKGTNWCTTDALMRFPEERYDRFLSLARHQNLQLLRAWGGGMPESDYFYRKCDELGLMVAQEWPTCWDSQKIQPMEALVETALIHTVRLRNHPSLLWWAGGNESQEADGKCMDALARIAYELDGTRPFRRTSPYGGSLHNYDTFWMMKEMDNALNLRSVFIGEFGMASAPNTESIHRYIPEDEWNIWQPQAKNCFNYHTPRFNEFRWPENYNDMDHLLFHALDFCEIKSIEDFVFATLMAQATAVRHTLEAARAASPSAAGICYYKLTDVYPACSWSTIDYYGVPKIPYYVFKNAYAPLHAVLLIRSVDAVGEYPLYLLDDTLAAAGRVCRVETVFYDRKLDILNKSVNELTPENAVNSAGSLRISEAAAKDVRIISLRLYCDGRLCDDTFYIQNYRRDEGCLKRLPETVISLKTENGSAVLQNNGSVPAVGVFLECLENSSSFTADDNFLMLLPGEERRIRVNITENLSVRGFNCRISE